MDCPRCGFRLASTGRCLTLGCRGLGLPTAQNAPKPSSATASPSTPSWLQGEALKAFQEVLGGDRTTVSTVPGLILELREALLTLDPDALEAFSAPAPAPPPDVHDLDAPVDGYIPFSVVRDVMGWDHRAARRLSAKRHQTLLLASKPYKNTKLINVESLIAWIKQHKLQSKWDNYLTKHKLKGRA